MFDSKLITIASEIVETLKNKNLQLVTAESCTGGLLASLITSISGSSQIFKKGLVTYSNQAKIDLLHISAEVLDNFSAVSVETAKLMAIGAQTNSHKEITIAITGIAGPNSDIPDKPVGLVFIAVKYLNSEVQVKKFNFIGIRDEIRLKACQEAMQILLETIPK